MFSVVYTRSYALMHTDTLTHIHACAHAIADECFLLYTLSHALTYTDIQTCTYVFCPIHTFIRSHTHWDTQMCTSVHTQRHTFFAATFDVPRTLPLLSNTSIPSFNSLFLIRTTLKILAQATHIQRNNTITPVEWRLPNKMCIVLYIKPARHKQDRATSEAKYSHRKKSGKYLFK
jgi:hypothetical protein